MTSPLQGRRERLAPLVKPLPTLPSKGRYKCFTIKLPRTYAATIIVFTKFLFGDAQKICELLYGLFGLNVVKYGYE